MLVASTSPLPGRRRAARWCTATAVVLRIVDQIEDERMHRDPPPRIPFSARLARGVVWEEAVAAWLMPKSAMILELFRYRYNGEAPAFIRLGDPQQPGIDGRIKMAACNPHAECGTRNSRCISDGEASNDLLKPGCQATQLLGRCQGLLGTGAR